MENKNIILKKWTEPYVLLETLKKSYNMKEITFDGFSKNSAIDQMSKFLSENSGRSFGLYMKNVNKFYLFSSDVSIENEAVMQDVLGFCESDYEFPSVPPVSLVDMAKAEAAFLFC